MCLLASEVDGSCRILDSITCVCPDARCAVGLLEGEGVRKQTPVNRMGNHDAHRGRREFDEEGRPAELGVAVFVLTYIGMCASMFIRFVGVGGG